MCYVCIYVFCSPKECSVHYIEFHVHVRIARKTESTEHVGNESVLLMKTCMCRSTYLAWWGLSLNTRNRNDLSWAGSKVDGTTT